MSPSTSITAASSPTITGWTRLSRFSTSRSRGRNVPTVAAPKRVSYVHEAAISLKAGTDPAAVGAAVTRELCAAVEHDGPCRWPHNNAIDPSGDIASFRTLFIAPESDEPEVRTRIQSALRSSDQWLVRSNGARPVRYDERALATQLARTPQPAGP